RAVNVTSHVVLGIWSRVVVLALLWVFLSACKSNREIISGSPLALPSSWSFDNFVLAWVDEKLGQAMLNTVIVVGCALALVMLLGARSEEHTSELQSRENLVCRLLLEKKNARSRG